MTRKVQCQKTGQLAEGLDCPPYPGELGQRIYEHISKAAWAQWINHQTMLINEYRLNMRESEAREFLVKEMEKYLFGDGSEKPAGYVQPDSEK